MQEAESLPSSQYHELRYEALAEHPHATANVLLDYLQIDDVRSRSQFHQAVDAADPASVGRWRDGLTNDQLAVVMAEAGPLLARLGYAGDLNCVV